MTWEIVFGDGVGCTERLAFEGGWLVRSSWRHTRGLGEAPLSGSAMTYVPVRDESRSTSTWLVANQQLAAQAKAQAKLMEECPPNPHAPDKPEPPPPFTAPEDPPLAPSPADEASLPEEEPDGKEAA